MCMTQHSIHQILILTKYPCYHLKNTFNSLVRCDRQRIGFYYQSSMPTLLNFCLVKSIVIRGIFLYIYLSDYSIYLFSAYITNIYLAFSFYLSCKKRWICFCKMYEYVWCEYLSVFIYVECFKVIWFANNSEIHNRLFLECLMRGL